MFLCSQLERKLADHLPLVELANNNSYQSNISITSFEALYGRPHHSPSCGFDNRDLVLDSPELVEEIIKQVELIKKKMMKKPRWTEIIYRLA